MLELSDVELFVLLFSEEVSVVEEFGFDEEEFSGLSLFFDVCDSIFEDEFEEADDCLLFSVFEESEFRPDPDVGLSEADSACLEDS